MSEQAHFVTQTSVYTAGVYVTGRLTNRKIKEWQKKGYYDGGLKLPPEPKRTRAPRGSKTTNSTGRRKRLLMEYE